MFDEVKVEVGKNKDFWEYWISQGGFSYELTGPFLFETSKASAIFMNDHMDNLKNLEKNFAKKHATFV